MKKYIKWFEMMRKAILIGPVGLEELANHEKSICSLAALIGDSLQAREIGEVYKTEQIKKIIDLVAMGIDVDSAKKIVNADDYI